MSSSLCFFKPFFKFEVVLLVQGVAASETTISPCKLREPFLRLTTSSRQTAEYNVLNINLFPEAIETVSAAHILLVSWGVKYADWLLKQGLPANLT